MHSPLCITLHQLSKGIRHTPSCCYTSSPFEGTYLTWLGKQSHSQNLGSRPTLCSSTTESSYLSPCLFHTHRTSSAPWYSSFAIQVLLLAGNAILEVFIWRFVMLCLATSFRLKFAWLYAQGASKAFTSCCLERGCSSHTLKDTNAFPSENIFVIARLDYLGSFGRAPNFLDLYKTEILGRLVTLPISATYPSPFFPSPSLA